MKKDLLIREAHPLKQGLKPVTAFHLHRSGIREAHPLKQGLKLVCPYALFFRQDSRGTSIKTRIETQRISLNPCYLSIIREAHPLKQGLKPFQSDGEDMRNPIREAHPLKQGLKLASMMIVFILFLIREAHPLKQGLKRNLHFLWFPASPHSRGTSIKTRIETLYSGVHGK